jgi:hypothetical protein
MFGFLKTETFKIVGSALLGVGLVAALKPVCKGPDCIEKKAPPVDEVSKSTYQIGSKCFKFKTLQITCPKEGSVIEPFDSYF